MTGGRVSSSVPPMAARRRVLWAALAGVAILGMLFALLAAFGDQATGPIVMSQDSTNHQPKPDELLSVTKEVLQTYADLIQIVSASFAVVAFLIGYQQKRNVALSGRAWALLTTGIILLTGALLFCLIGREMLLTMMAQNSVDLSLARLLYTRWAAYGCLVGAGALVGFYAVEAAVPADSYELTEHPLLEESD
jgi:hypothetical protein